MNKFSLVAAVLMLLLTTGCKEEVKKAEIIRPVRIFTVNGHEAADVRTFPGKVTATQEVNLSFRVSGQLMKLDVKEGDFVKKGQLIAQLDQRDHRAAIADLLARIKGARSRLQEAKLNYERNKKLLKSKIIAKSAFDSASSTYETNRAEVLSLEQSLRRARLDLQYTDLKAPFDGTIAVKSTDNHKYVRAQETIARLEDTSSLDIAIDVPESLWVRVLNAKDGFRPKADARFESLPGKTFPLKLKEYQTAANADTQTYRVTLNMDIPAGVRISPGMIAEVSATFPKSGKGDGKLVPTSAVLGEQDGPTYVWLLGKGNMVSKHEVKLGRMLDGFMTVKTGLATGQRIVSAGVHHLHEGQVVSVLKGRIGGRK